MTLSDFVNQTLRLWEEAALKPDMHGVRFDIAAEILRNTYAVKEMIEEYDPLTHSCSRPGFDPLTMRCAQCEEAMRIDKLWREGEKP